MADPELSTSSPNVFNQKDYTIADILTEKGKSVEWEYDKSDSWCHDIQLLSVGTYADGEPLVSFVKGERACPPEDCGGILRYQELLVLHEKVKVHKPLTHEEKERLKCFEINPFDFDPEEFDNRLAKEICEMFCEYSTEP